MDSVRSFSRVVLFFASCLVLLVGCKLEIDGKKSAAVSSSGSSDPVVQEGSARLALVVRTLLRREPTLEELSGLARLTAKSDQASVAVSKLVRDAVRRKTILDSLCVELLERACTAQEADLYLGLSDQPGNPGEREEIVGLLVSDDAKARAAALGVPLVELIYQKLLKRSPSDLESREFAKALRDHAPATVVTALTLTDEAATLVVETWITQYAVAEPPGDQKQSYVDQVKSGARFEDVLTRFVTIALIH